MKFGTLKPSVGMLSESRPGVGTLKGQKARGSQRVQGKAGQRQRERILKRDKFTCRACGRIGLPDELHVDHIVPLFKGGSAKAESNLQLLCITPCHEAKTARERSEVASGGALTRYGQGRA